MNHHREECAVPSEFICVDESISRWYGVGRSWTGVGIPTYIEMDWKPDKGCKIETSCCGRSKIMLRLGVVKSDEREGDVPIEGETLPHGASILSGLVSPLLNSDRVVCTDS